MIYFKAKKNIEVVERFRNLVEEFWDIGANLRQRQRRMSRHEDISDEEIKLLERLDKLREEIAKSTPKLIRLANQNGVQATLKSYPAPMVGGPIITLNVFNAILNDDSHSGVDHQRIIDTINTLIGQLEERVEREFRKLINPFFWLGLLIEKILRFPFWLLSKTGFDVNKIEDHFWGKFFKVLEVLIILYIAIRLGVSDEIISKIFSFIK